MKILDKEMILVSGCPATLSQGFLTSFLILILKTQLTEKRK
jgi:hypothetical protein